MLLREVVVPVAAFGCGLASAEGITDFNNLTGLGLFAALVFTIGWRQVAATSKVDDTLKKMEVALVNGQHLLADNTAAQTRASVAIEKLCEQMRDANAAVVHSQTELANRNLAESVKVWTRIEDALAELRAQVEALRRRDTRDDGPSRPRRGS